MVSFRDIILWRDIKVTTIVFVSGFVFLVCLTQFSLLTVLSTTSMIALVPMLVLRLLFSARSAFWKTEFKHPLHSYLNKDINVSKDKADDIGEKAASYFAHYAVCARNLFLVADLADSVKLLIVLYFLSYIASWFSGITITFMAFIGLFTIPKIYDMYKPEINKAMETIRKAIDDLLDKINAAVPVGKPSKDDKKSNGDEKDKSA
ncbi:reticulon-1-A [Exaiptasia diaphana]|uniref:Reticulon-like protein n=1 Tax=Exaiptasia diaphana TaxID=2652724 RepID=A0A913WT37_EXADI|nr:reticulon-1-A [Exaiptasia diaphana]KXJ18080.1 Reticulon-1-A [Exaiptasia diaphana]